MSTLKLGSRLVLIRMQVSWVNVWQSPFPDLLPALETPLDEQCQWGTLPRRNIGIVQA